MHNHAVCVQPTTLCGLDALQVATAQKKAHDAGSDTFSQRGKVASGVKVWNVHLVYLLMHVETDTLLISR